MLAQLVPAPLVRLFARPYVAGDSIELALARASRLYTERGLLSSLDLLGEGVTSPEEAQHNLRHYEEMIDRIADDPRFSDGVRPSVSLKPSAFTAGAEEAVREPITALAVRAHDRGVALTIDMEERRWTNFTLDLDAIHTTPAPAPATVPLFVVGLTALLSFRSRRPKA